MAAETIKLLFILAIKEALDGSILKWTQSQFTEAEIERILRIESGKLPHFVNVQAPTCGFLSL